MLVFAVSFDSPASSGWTDYARVIELVPTIHHRFKVNIDVEQNESGCERLLHARRW